MSGSTLTLCCLPLTWRVKSLVMVARLPCGRIDCCRDYTCETGPAKGPVRRRRLVELSDAARDQHRPRDQQQRDHRKHRHIQVHQARTTDVQRDWLIAVVVIGASAI